MENRKWKISQGCFRETTLLKKNKLRPIICNKYIKNLKSSREYNTYKAELYPLIDLNLSRV